MDRQLIDTVLFDLDGTLCNYSRAGDEVLTIAFETIGVDPYFSIDEYLDQLRTSTGEYETFADHREACFLDLTRSAGYEPATGRALAQAYADERDQSNVDFCRGAHRALDQLSNEFSLGLVTNGGPDIQIPKLESLGIRDHFDSIVYAGYDTPAKPDPRPFERALAEIGSSPDRAVHVGNSLTDDVAGARAAGVAAIWYGQEPDPDPAPDEIINSLDELIDRSWG